MSTRDLVSWTRPQLDRMQQALDSTLQAWASDWMLAEPPGTSRLGVCEVIAAHRSGNLVAVMPWKRLAQRREAISWISGDDEVLERSIEALLFGGTPSQRRSSSLGGRIAERAKVDLLRVMAESLELDVANPQSAEKPATELHRWSGTVLARIEIGVGRVSLLMNAACAERLARAATESATAKTVSAATPLSPLRDALASSTVRILAELQPMDVQIGSLLGMARGDVLKLTHRLEDPLILSTDAQTDFCAAHLVQLDGRLAVEFATVPKEKP